MPGVQLEIFKPDARLSSFDMLVPMFNCERESFKMKEKENDQCDIQSTWFLSMEMNVRHHMLISHGRGPFHDLDRHPCLLPRPLLFR